LQTGHMATRFS